MIRRLLVIILLAMASTPAYAQSFRDGAAAFNRSDYTKAARILGPIAEQGNQEAQTYLGFMYANGRGVPQDYHEAVRWYRRASEQGNPSAQFLLGLCYDKGQGVPLDFVQAYKWLNLAVAHASAREREFWQRIRDRVSSKMTPADVIKAQRLALAWRPQRELAVITPATGK
jgi:uncharacterized protein